MPFLNGDHSNKISQHALVQEKLFKRRQQAKQKEEHRRRNAAIVALIVFVLGVVFMIFAYIG